MGLSNWARESISNIQNKSLAFALKHAAHTLYLSGVGKISPLFDDGEVFWDDSWDVLVILDACRPDLMREACTTASYEWLPEPDDLTTIRSPGSTSHEWMEAHFDEKNREMMEQTGCITSNLFIKDYPFERFPVFSQIESDLELADGVQFVEPRQLTDRAIDVWRRREELGVDRLIVHYMQPHTPFRSKPEWFTDVDYSTGWGLGFVELRDGKFDKTDFYNAYLENLLWVLEDIDLLTKNCDADIAISSDHGNGLGEWGIYGHPNGIPFDVVREVPWLTVSGTDNETHIPDLPADYLEQTRELEQSAVEDQLEALGYAD